MLLPQSWQKVPFESERKCRKGGLWRVWTYRFKSDVLDDSAWWFSLVQHTKAGTPSHFKIDLQPLFHVSFRGALALLKQIICTSSVWSWNISLNQEYMRRWNTQIHKVLAVSPLITILIIVWLRATTIERDNPIIMILDDIYIHDSWWHLHNTNHSWTTNIVVQQICIVHDKLHSNDIRHIVQQTP